MLVYTTNIASITQQTASKIFLLSPALLSHVLYIGLLIYNGITSSDPGNIKEPDNSTNTGKNTNTGGSTDGDGNQDGGMPGVD